MKLSLVIASEKDAANIAALLSEAAMHLTTMYGKGHWSHQSSEKGILYGMKSNSKVLIASSGNKLLGTLRLTTRKPWAIDVAYFTKVDQPLYLVDMAVHPDVQRRGIGRNMLKETIAIVKSWPAQAIRLDAYNATAGAGDFYHKCGFKERGKVIFQNTPLRYFEMIV